MKQQDHFAKCRDQILRPFAQNLDPPGEAEECNPPIVRAHLLLPLLEYGKHHCRLPVQWHYLDLHAEVC